MRLRTLMGVLLLVLALATPARAVEYTVDFDSAPPAEGVAITNEYLDDAFVQFLLADPGFRPARRLVSGANYAADVGAARCGPGEGQGGNDCELVTGGTVFQLSRTANSLSIDAGLFIAPFQAVTVQLKAYAAGGNTPVATSPVVPLTTSFTNPVSVSSMAGNIQRVELVVGGPGAGGAEVGFDNLKIDYSASLVPDFAVSAGASTVVIPQGSSIDVPLSIVRVNGSSGNLAGNITDLPAGVTAQLLPDPVTGTGSTATVRLSAAATAPSFFDTKQVIVELQPADANVGPAPRAAPLSVVVRSQFDLVRGASGLVAIPKCAPVDTDIVVQRELNFNSTHTVTLSVSGAPPGVDAQLLPDAIVEPGGDLYQHVTLRLTAGDNTLLPLNASVLVTGTSPNAPTRTVSVPITLAQPAATLDPTTLYGGPPSRLQPGKTVRLNGNGFCPGAHVEVGNALATAPLTVDPSATSATFVVPRLATSGPVRVITAVNLAYAAGPAELSVGTTRNGNGFAFDNPGWGNLSFEEMTNVVGVDEMFLEVNPCWPFYDCSIPTPVPNPLSYAKWQIIEEIAQESGGHCFGINRFLQEVGAGRIRPSDFMAGAGNTYSLPKNAVESYLDERHVGQFTTQFIVAWLQRNQSLATQLQRARNELAANRLPGLIVKKSWDQGHVVTAHDIETNPDGSTTIWLYDNETPYLPEETTDRSGATHSQREDASKITINAAKTQWKYSDWSGGGGTFMTTVLNDWPAGTEPSLPGIDALTTAVLFGSAGGAATMTRPPGDGIEMLPALDEHAIPGAAGMLVADKGTKTITQTMEGHKDGSYSQVFVAPGFVGSVKAPTDKGVTDTFAGKDGSISFSGEQTRPVDLQVGEQDGGTAQMATISTRSAAGGSDTAGMDGDALVYDHDGPATTATFAFQTVTQGKGVTEFTSGPVSVRAGETLRVTPSAGGATVVGRSKAGKRRLRLRDRAGALAAKVRLRGLGVKDGSARVTVRFAKVPAHAVAGVVLRVLRGRKVVAKRGFSVRSVTRGSKRFAFDLPGGLKGRYVLRADAVVSAAGAAGGSRHVSASRAFSR